MNSGKPLSQEVQYIEHVIRDILAPGSRQYLWEIRDALAACQRIKNPEISFRAALIDAVIDNMIYRPEHESDPQACIADIVKDAVRDALDPTISPAAQSLIERGRREALTPLPHPDASNPNY